MRLMHLPKMYLYGILPRSNSGKNRSGSFFKKIAPAFLLLLWWISSLAHTGPESAKTFFAANGESYSICLACDNVINGGAIEGNEFGCPSPEWDPGLITNVTLPAGGTGNLEFIWIFTTDDPNQPLAQWTPIPGTDSSQYDPGPISVTTYFRRCARRAGCTDYVGESNIVMKEAICCDNVTDGGVIGFDQSNCTAPFNPAFLENVTLPSGGSGALEYQWVSSTTGTPYSATNPDWVLIPGADSVVYDPDSIMINTWFIRLARRHGCTDYPGVSNMVLISIQSTVFIDSLNSLSPSCQGGSDGSIHITFNGGDAPYQFQWSPDLGNVMNPVNVSAGAYFVTVTDVNGCSATDSIIVADGLALGLLLESNAESCFGANDGSATVANVSGGQPSYTYIWNDPPGQTASSISGLAPGQYFVTVTDANGCSSVDSIQVGFGPFLQIQTAATPVLCFNGSSGTSAVINVTGGIAPYNYQWDDPDSQNNSTAVNLAAGTYNVMVTDTIGCIGMDSVVVDNATPLALTISGTNPVCPGGTDGTTTVEASGGAVPYAYLWDDGLGQTTASATNLAPALYHVTVTDANGCTIIDSVAVNDTAAPQFSIASTNVSCFGGNDGSATLTFASADPASFTYLWNDPAQSTGLTVVNLSSGTYDVTITDTPGCTFSGTAIVDEAPALIAMLNSDSASCANASDGTASVTITGGTPFSDGTYQYLWDAPGNPTVSSLDDVAPGQYTVIVTDANGCAIIGSVEIGAPVPITINIMPTPISCIGASDAALTAAVQGGVEPYSYQWDDPSLSSTPAITGLGQGTYHLTVTDANGCTGIASAQIAEPPVLSLAIDKQDVICEDDNNGSAQALPAGGTGPYTYQWSTGGTTAQITGLSTGSYGLSVTDDHGCSVSSAFEIIFTSDLALSVSAQDAHCFNSNDGTATATTTGGTEPYAYQWSNGGTDSTQTGLAPGVYSVTLTDADGCQHSDSVQISAPALLNCQTQMVAPVSLFGGSDGGAAVTASGGTGTYSYLWSDGTTADTVLNLQAGLHSVTVTDENNCICVSHITLTNPSKIGDFVWDDQNQNGVQDPAESGLAGIEVQLSGTTVSGSAVSQTTATDSNGFYVFDGLEEGFYQLSFALPPTSVFTIKDFGDDSSDSDVDPATGQTGTFALANEFYDKKWDCGIVVLDDKVNIGDFIWLDQNKNGIQDVNEFGLEGITVRLKTVPGNATVATKVTNLLGHYLFENVSPGAYVVEIPLTSLPNGYVLSPQDQGADDAKDSDMDIITGQTTPFQVLPYTLDNLTIDAGIYKECDNITDGGLIGYNEDLCGFGTDPANIVNVSLPTGGYGNIEYLWLESNVPVYNGPGDPNWSMIPNSNAPNYDPGPINLSTFYIRCARREGCAAYTGETNIVAKTITPNPLTQIIDEPGQLCENENGRFEAAIAGGAASYFWEFGSDATPQTASSRVVNDVSWATQGLKTVNLTVTRFGCSDTVTTTVLITGCNSPLIVVENLNAVVQGSQIKLTWAATGDLTNVVFFIQRSEDGAIFENMAAMSKANELPGGGYEFTDLNPLFGENTYRIKYKNTAENATEGYSGSTTAFYQPEGMGLIHTYPNPAKGAITLELFKPSDTPVLVEISNAYGTVLKSVQCPPLETRHQFDISELPAGIYLLSVQQKGYREIVKKIVKTE